MPLKRLGNATSSKPVPRVRLAEVGEHGLLKQLAGFAAGDQARLLVGYGDDAAVWDPDPTSRRAPLLIATTDTMVEGTHFRLAWATWEEIGRKLVASNVSDVAAMGGRPTLALVSLACPPSTPLRDVTSLYRGLRKECRRWGIRLAGGDSVRADCVVLTLALLGEKPRGVAACRRNGLRRGQRIYVTGQPGESGAGLALLNAEGTRARTGARWKRRLVQRHLIPAPRLAAGQALARAFPDLAMIDVSDGIDNELHLLAESSGSRVVVSLESLPVSPVLRRMQREIFRTDPLRYVLSGGEDYELLFATAAQPGRVAKVVAAAEPGLAIHEIGRVLGDVRDGRVEYHDSRGRPARPPSLRTFEHFSRTANRR